MKVILRSAGALSLCMTLAVVCMASRTPGWYRPTVVDPADLQAVRDRLSEATVVFNRGLAARQPFEWVLHERDLNEWIATRGEIYPESAGWVPEDLKDVVVLARDGAVRLGAKIDRSVYHGVISLQLTAEIEDEQVRIRLSGTGIGALPLPTRLIARLVEPFVKNAPDLKGGIAASRSPSHEASLSQMLSEGLLIKNDFTHPEGDWRFRLQSIDIRDGEIRVGVQPL